jgi:kynurenine formamidase
MKVIDLSHTIQGEMQIYPGDPKPSIERGLTHEKNYCHVDKLKLGSHTGTHIDAPYHFFSEGERIDTIVVDRVVGYGVLIDVTGKSDHHMIQPRDIDPFKPEIRPNDFVIFRTGWDQNFGSDRYLRHPILSAASAELLRQCGVSLVGIDALNVDPSLDDAVSVEPTAKPEGHGEVYGYPVHDILLKNDILIVENLCNLDQVDQIRGVYSFLPLKLKGSDGSPVRAVYISL